MANIIYILFYCGVFFLLIGTQNSLSSTVWGTILKFFFPRNICFSTLLYSWNYTSVATSARNGHISSLLFPCLTFCVEKGMTAQMFFPEFMGEQNCNCWHIPNCQSTCCFCFPKSPHLLLIARFRQMFL